MILLQSILLAVVLTLVWMILAPADQAAGALGWGAAGICALAVTLAAVRAGVLGGRSGGAIATALADSLRSAPRTARDAARVLARVLMGPPPRPALVIVQVNTSEQPQAARVAAALSRSSQAFTIDGDERTMLVHVLDEHETTSDALHLAAAAHAREPNGAGR